jgi:hypothetical protein
MTWWQAWAESEQRAHGCLLGETGLRSVRRSYRGGGRRRGLPDCPDGRFGWQLRSFCVLFWPEAARSLPNGG